MILNRESYDLPSFNNYSSGNSDCYEDEMLTGIKTGTYCSLRNIADLSNVVNARIKSIYPNVLNPCVDCNDVNTPFYPRGSNYFHRTITVMWTHIKH